MARRQLLIEIPALGAFDRRLGEIGRQLADQLRQAVASGELGPGEPLPSSRSLAMSLGVSRGTVTQAYDQLIAEGCLYAQPGGNTRVAAVASQSHIASQQVAIAASRLPPTPARASRYAAMGEHFSPLPCVPFSIAVPAGAVAMDHHWRRLSNRVRLSPMASPSGYGQPSGLPALREAIADYLRRTRAVRCDPENIIITEGTQQGLYLSAKILLDPGDAAWAEDPAYPGLMAVLEERGIDIHRIAVDNQGFNLAAALNACPAAKVAFVTPSHQYPMGMPLSMSRRLALLDWAKKSDGWIVEDDYDSQLRFAGQPFPSLQGLDSSRVIYLGTFSKMLAPSLRLGYIVAPKHLTNAFIGARALIGRGSPVTEQHVIAAYIREGYFEAHIRRIRAIYSERRQLLLDALQSELPHLRIQPGDQGMHIVAWLPEGINDVAVARAAQTADIALRAISPMCSANLRLSGLMLGFGGFTGAQLNHAVSRLRRLLHEHSDDNRIAAFKLRPGSLA